MTVLKMKTEMYDWKLNAYHLCKNPYDVEILLDIENLKFRYPVMGILYENKTYAVTCNYSLTDFLLIPL